MGRPLNKRNFGNQAGTIKPSSWRRATGNEDNSSAYIVKQYGTKEFLVAAIDNSWQELMILVDKESGTLLPGEFRIESMASDNNVLEVKKFYDNVIINSSGTKHKWNQEESLDYALHGSIPTNFIVDVLKEVNDLSVGGILLNTVAAGEGYFTQTVATSGWYAAATQPPAVYDSNTNQTYIAYSIIEPGDELGLFTHIRAYDHDTDEWSLAYSVGRRHNITDDNHGMPSMAINNDGRIVIFWGGHNTDLYMAISENPGDITRWGESFTISGNYTYAHPITMVDGSMSLFLRDRIFPGAEFSAGAYPMVFRSITFAGTTPTVGAEIRVGDMGDDSRWYLGNTYLRPDGLIHQVCARADFDDNLRKHVYILLIDPAGQTVTNVSKTETVNWPIGLTDLNTNFRVYEHSSDSSITGNIPFMIFDTSNRYHLTFNVGDVPSGSNQDPSPQEFFHMIISADGQTIFTPEKIADGDQRYESATLAARANGEVAIYYPSLENLRGGNTLRRVVPNGGSSDQMTPEELIHSYDTSRKPFFQFFGLPADANPDFEVVWCEQASTATNDDGRGGGRGYAYGSSGLLTRPETVDVPLPSGLYAAYDCNDASNLFSDLGGSTAINGDDADVVQFIRDITGNGNDLTFDTSSQRNALYRIEDSGNFVQMGRQRSNVANDVNESAFTMGDVDFLDSGICYVGLAFRPVNFDVAGNIISMDDGSSGSRQFILTFDPVNRRMRGIIHNTGGNHADAPNSTLVTGTDCTVGLNSASGSTELSLNGVVLGTGDQITTVASNQIYFGAQNDTLSNPSAFRFYRAAFFKGTIDSTKINEIESWLRAGFDKI